MTRSRGQQRDVRSEEPNAPSRGEAGAVTGYFSAHDRRVLLLQGGGALGAYHGGVYEGLADAGFAPDWVVGISIGAINAALIVGNPPAKRIERLHEFWDMVSAMAPVQLPAGFDFARPVMNRMAAASAMFFGIPGFFVPRVPAPLFVPDGSLAALSYYDTEPRDGKRCATAGVSARRDRRRVLPRRRDNVQHAAAVRRP